MKISPPLEPQIDKALVEIMDVSHAKMMVRWFTKDGFSVRSVEDKKIIMRSESKEFVAELYIGVHTTKEAANWVKDFKEHFTSGLLDLTVKCVDETE